MATVGRPAVVHVLSRVVGLAQSIQTRIPDVTVINIQSGHGDYTSMDPLPERSLEQVKAAEVLIADPHMLTHARLLHDLPNLLWMHSTWAGVETIFSSLDKSKPPPQFVLTRQAGLYGGLIAEYVLGHIISLERRYTDMVQAQKDKRWDNLGFSSYRSLSELTLGILGVGTIGKEVARAAKCFGMTVWGLVRKEITDDNRCPHIDSYRQFDGLAELLQSCDYVCSVLPSTPQTVGLLSGDMLSNCKHKKSTLINVGRGDLVDDKSLIHALSQGWLSHAVLDVFNEEPLPKDNPLWEHPNVVITHHTAAIASDWFVADSFVENYKKYCKGETLDYIVDWKAGY